MRKKIVSLCYAALLIAGLAGVSAPEVRAEDARPVIDGSYLTHEEESVGYAGAMTRGVDLLVGYSKSVRLGPGLLYAGGSTIAARIVDEVGIAVMVERAQEGDDSWTFYDSWTKFNHNIDKVSDNRRLEVEGDYYYRVRCVHSANSDMSSSFTDGVYIEEPQILPGIPEMPGIGETRGLIHSYVGNLDGAVGRGICSGHYPRCTVETINQTFSLH